MPFQHWRIFGIMSFFFDHNSPYLFRVCPIQLGQRWMPSRGDKMILEAKLRAPKEFRWGRTRTGSGSMKFFECWDYRTTFNQGITSNWNKLILRNKRWRGKKKKKLHINSKKTFKTKQNKKSLTVTTPTPENRIRLKKKIKSSNEIWNYVATRYEEKE